MPNHLPTSQAAFIHLHRQPAKVPGFNALCRYAMTAFLILLLPASLSAQAPGKVKRMVIEGQVLDYNDTLLPGIQVVLEAPQRANYFSTTTDANGQFRMKVESAEGYFLFGIRDTLGTEWDPNRADFAAQKGKKRRWYTLQFSKPVEVPKPVVPVVPTGYMVQGRVLNAYGSPTEGADVVVSAGSGRFFKVQADAEGRFSFHAEDDEEFYIYPSKTVGDVKVTSTTQIVTAAMAAENGEGGFVLRFLPEQSEDDGAYMVGMEEMGVVGEVGGFEFGGSNAVSPPQPIDPATRKVQVFPNMDLGFMNVYVNDTTKVDFAVRLINANGEEVATLDWHSFPGDGLMMGIGRLPKGKYLVELKDPQGNKASQQLLIE